ncbi:MULTISPECIES: hypothetical protein [Bradyrhizobium]|uniref:Uncharacterized protein n=2 Tax=Bradyrhizobium TaxID=374 RepID=A0A9X9YK44_9BRAD|nr:MULTISPECIES: hypothetical protein [Bradyrhizobium]MCD9260563.1 hypothetical protein [Bradyrhizobium japonicum SEMIA 5079]MCS3979594.1 hypothetical protein [Bradyrhizobium japonicum]MEB2677135.1 hypothetical protein [Bradyrhizobium japonicum]UGX91299.1 hypothetical protein G6321_00036790 [Bradyrhizobium barranii subsp. barranii]WRI69398.1 hypothetical protein RZE83_33245 [Bradyrhizobium japonicum]
MKLLPKLIVDIAERAIDLQFIPDRNNARVWNDHVTKPVVLPEMTVVVAPPPFFLERQMSKRKPATVPKRARNPKMAARAQRNKQAIVRSPKENLLRSVAAVSIEPPPELHDDRKHEVPVIEPRVNALPDDVSQRMTGSDPTKGFALATANMQAYQAKLLEMAGANAQFALEFGLRLATIRSPTEFFGVIYGVYK